MPKYRIPIIGRMTVCNFVLVEAESFDDACEELHNKLIDGITIVFENEKWEPIIYGDGKPDIKVGGIDDIMHDEQMEPVEE